MNSSVFANRNVRGGGRPVPHRLPTRVGAVRVRDGSGRGSRQHRLLAGRLRAGAGPVPERADLFEDYEPFLHIEQTGVGGFDAQARVTVETDHDAESRRLAGEVESHRVAHARPGDGRRASGDVDLAEHVVQRFGQVLMSRYSRLRSDRSRRCGGRCGSASPTGRYAPPRIDVLTVRNENRETKPLTWSLIRCIGHCA